MAGLQHYAMKMDPGIQKQGAISTNRYKYFRWTPRTARVSFVFLGIVPSILLTLAYQTDGKFDPRAKRKGDLIVEY